MKSVKLLLLLFSVNSFGLFKTTHAEPSLEKNIAADPKNKDEAIVHLDKGNSVKTALNDNMLPSLNITKAYDIPKIRKVTPVDNKSEETRLKNAAIAIEGKRVSTTNTAFPLNETKMASEAGVLDIKGAPVNAVEEVKANIARVDPDRVFKNITGQIEKEIKNSSSHTVPTVTKTSSGSDTTTVKPSNAANSNLSSTNTTTVARSNTISKNSSPTTSAASSSSTTTTTTTTTTAKPKKPTITYSVPDFPDLEKDNPELKHLLQSSVSNKLPAPDAPYAQPSQEFNGSFHRGRDFILPIVSMIFIIPLVIGIIITSYRRFRDCWSTRHYRRMDFLVDGMYND